MIRRSTISNGTLKFSKAPTNHSIYQRTGTTGTTPVISSCYQRAAASPMNESLSHRVRATPTLSSRYQRTQKISKAPTNCSIYQRSGTAPTNSSCNQRAAASPMKESLNHRVRATPTLSSGYQRISTASINPSKQQSVRSAQSFYSGQPSVSAVPTGPRQHQRFITAPLTPSQQCRVPNRLINPSQHQIISTGARHTYGLKLNITIIPICCRDIEIGWQKLPGTTYYRVNITKTDIHNIPTINGKIYRVPSITNHLIIPGLTPGCNYKITVETEGTQNFISETQFYRAILVKAEVQELLKKARNFMLQFNNNNIQIIDMYRNKPFQYFNDIIQNKGCIMHKYKKDFNGDPGSPINGAIDGLFFHIWLDRTGNPFRQSPYGDVRISLPLKDYIIPGFHNVYFADFWCHNIQHYVTLVVTERGSREDRFCQEHLPELGLHGHSNPFFFFDHARNKFLCSSKPVVEILYCMDINLENVFKRRAGCNFYSVQTMGHGSSKPEGIPKNAYCNTCNLNKTITRGTEPYIPYQLSDQFNNLRLL